MKVTLSLLFHSEGARTPMLRHAIAIGVVCSLVQISTSSADPGKPPAASPAQSDTEFIVPPQGGTASVDVHLGEVCILSFPAAIAGRLALMSSADFEVKRWGDREVAVRPLAASAKQTTLAIATAGDELKVNVTLSVVGADKPAFTYVRFRAVSAAEALNRQVDAAVAKRTATLEHEIEKLRANLDAITTERTEDLVAKRLLTRNQSFPLSAHERNDDHVILHVTQGTLFGADGYLTLEIENRSSAPFRIYELRVEAGARVVSTAAELEADVEEGGAGVKGVVPARATARGVVVVRSVDKLLGQPLAVILAGPPDSQPIRIDRGIVFR